VALEAERMARAITIHLTLKPGFGFLKEHTVLYRKNGDARSPQDIRAIVGGMFVAVPDLDRATSGASLQSIVDAITRRASSLRVPSVAAPVLPPAPPPTALTAS